MKILKKNNIIKKSIHNIKKFINKLDFHSLNKKHFLYINDPSYISKQDRGKHFLLSYILIIKKNFSKIKIFAPQSIPVVLWNLLMFIVLLSQVFAIPLKISYNLQFDDDFIASTFLI